MESTANKEILKLGNSGIDLVIRHQILGASIFANQ